MRGIRGKGLGVRKIRAVSLCPPTTALKNFLGASPRGVGPLLLASTVIRLTFWFACFLAIIGAAWRPPLASVGLIVFFLVLLVALEWASRRLIAQKSPPTSLQSPLPQSETVQQQMTRTRTIEGLDRLESTFWAEFPADAMTATVHIPFCPAFERVPKVQVLPADATSASLRIVSPKTFGVRIDVKRNNLESDHICFVVVAEEQRYC